MNFFTYSVLVEVFRNSTQCNPFEMPHITWLNYRGQCNGFTVMHYFVVSLPMAVQYCIPSLVRANTGTRLGHGVWWRLSLPVTVRDFLARCLTARFFQSSWLPTPQGTSEARQKYKKEGRMNDRNGRERIQIATTWSNRLLDALHVCVV